MNPTGKATTPYNQGYDQYKLSRKGTNPYSDLGKRFINSASWWDTGFQDARLGKIRRIEHNPD